MSIKEKKISEIISYLENLRNNNKFSSYSIDKNIIFFKSIFSIKKFIFWLIKELPKIDKEKLTELTDFGNEKYSKELHRGMIKVERGKIPGFIVPAVKKISSFIENKKTPLVIADLGSGSAELTKQIIEKILKSNYKQRVTIIAFDQSEASHEIAAENLSSLKDVIEFHKFNNLYEKDLSKIINNNSEKKINIIFTNNDIFRISEDFKDTVFDISYHSFFKHHLNNKEKYKLDDLLKKSSKINFEYDGYHSFIGLCVQAFFVWRHPVLLNGAVFSNIRYYTKNELKKFADKRSLKLYKRGNNISYRGTYLRIF